MCVLDFVHTILINELSTLISPASGSRYSKPITGKSRNMRQVRYNYISNTWAGKTIRIDEQILAVVKSLYSTVKNEELDKFCILETSNTNNRKTENVEKVIES